LFLYFNLQFALFLKSIKKYFGVYLFLNFVVASTQVVLTVQQKPVTSSGGAAAVTAIATATTATTTSGLQVGVVGATSQQPRPVSLSTAGNMSPSQPVTSLHRASTAPAGSAPCNTRITGPQPVDVSKSTCIVLVFLCFHFLSRMIKNGTKCEKIRIL